MTSITYLSKTIALTNLPYYLDPCSLANLEQTCKIVCKLFYSLRNSNSSKLPLEYCLGFSIFNITKDRLRELFTLQQSLNPIHQSYGLFQLIQKKDFLTPWENQAKSMICLLKQFNLNRSLDKEQAILLIMKRLINLIEAKITTFYFFEQKSFLSVITVSDFLYLRNLISCLESKTIISQYLRLAYLCNLPKYYESINDHKNNQALSDLLAKVTSTPNTNYNIHLLEFHLNMFLLTLTQKDQFFTFKAK